MEKLDLKKQFKEFYKPSAKKVSVVEVPRFNFAMVGGTVHHGEKPAEAPEYQQALQILYGISYTLKFASKKRSENPIDYTVMALEGLWWFAGKEFDFQWDQDLHFTSMIMQPDHITYEMFESALTELGRKKPELVLDKLRFESFEEGLCAQIMHIGPYTEEPATVQKLKDFVKDNGYQFNGKHHEIYLSDPRRTAPEKLKTILRYPVRKAA